MKNLTFLMPCRIESNDRLRNIITSISYLLYNFPESKIIVYESDKQSIYSQNVLPNIKNIFGKEPINLRHIFNCDENSFFHKTKVLNNLLLEANTDIVYNYDVDIVFPVSSYHKAYDMITTQNYDAVYTYGVGAYQLHVNHSDELLEKFIQSNFNLEILNDSCRLGTSVMGWGQMIRKQSEIDSYFWNENFMSWGPEDCEFLYRIQVMGLKVGRVNNYGYHFEHARTFNSHYNNPKWQDNFNLWNSIRTWDKERLVNYYEQQKYVKKLRRQLNVGI
jgi:hypothetical protein